MLWAITPSEWLPVVMMRPGLITLTLPALLPRPPRMPSCMLLPFWLV